MLWIMANLGLGIVESLVNWICIFSFMEANGQTIFRKKRWYVLGGMLAAAIQFGTAAAFPGNWMTVGVPLLLTLILGCLLFHRGPQALTFDILFAVVLVLGMECGIFIMNLIAQQIHFENVLQFGTFCLVIKIIIILLIAWRMIKWRKNELESTLPLRQALVIVALPGFSLFFLYSLLEMLGVYIQLEGVWLVLANIILLMLLNVYFLYLFGYLFRTKKLEAENEFFQMQNEMQYHYYEQLERKYQESRKIFHDMKNHLQAVEQLYEEKNKEAGDAYAKDLYHMLNIMGEKYYSSNHMLNIILNEKFSAARKAGIQVKAEIGDVVFDDLKDIDITSIFANLLDNAVEAASKAGEGAFLDLKIDSVQDFRVIQIRNSRKAGDGNMEKRSVDNSKDPGKAGNHRVKHMGLGLVNVQNALEKYHGSLEHSMSDTEYRISVMIPGRE